jgi:hypothetical protein
LPFVDDDHTAVLWLANVPKVVASSDRIIVVCPTYAPGPLTRKALGENGVYIVPFGQADPLVLGLDRALSQPVRPLTLAALSDQEESECEEKGLRCRLAIHINRRPAGRRGVVVEVGGVPIKLSET